MRRRGAGREADDGFGRRLSRKLLGGTPPAEGLRPPRPSRQRYRRVEPLPLLLLPVRVWAAIGVALGVFLVLAALLPATLLPWLLIGLGLLVGLVALWPRRLRRPPRR